MQAASNCSTIPHTVLFRLQDLQRAHNPPSSTPRTNLSPSPPTLMQPADGPPGRGGGRAEATGRGQRQPSRPRAAPAVTKATNGHAAGSAPLPGSTDCSSRSASEDSGAYGAGRGAKAHADQHRLVCPYTHHCSAPLLTKRNQPERTDA